MTMPILDVKSILKDSWNHPYDLHPEHHFINNDRPCVIHAHYWNFKAARATLYYLSHLDIIHESLNHVDYEPRIDIVLSLAEIIENVFDELALKRDMTDRTSIAIYIEEAKKFPYDFTHTFNLENDSAEIYIPEAELSNDGKAEYISARAIIANLQRLRVELVGDIDREAINMAFESVGPNERGIIVERLAALIKASHDASDNNCKQSSRFSS